MTPEQWERLHPDVRAVASPLPPLDGDISEADLDLIFPNRHTVLPQLVRDMAQAARQMEREVAS